MQEMTNFSMPVTNVSANIPQSPEVNLYLYTASTVILVILCVVGALGNCVIVMSFLLFKETRENQSLLLLGQALADVVFALGTVISAFGRLLPTVTGVKGLTKGYYLGMAAGIFFGRPWSVSMMFCLALERFSAAVFPFWYRSVPSNRFFWVCTPLTCVFSILVLMLNFTLVDLGEVPASSSIGSIVHPVILAIVLAINQLLTLAVPIVYFTSLIVMKHRIRQLTSGQEELTEVFEKEKKTHRTVVVIMLFFVGTVLVGEFIFILSRLGLFREWVVLILVQAGSAVNAGCNFFVYFSVNKQLRESFVKIYKKFYGSNSVAPTNIYD